MGIRYYAYAFDPHQTEQALARPQTILCSYCQEEVWGPEPEIGWVRDVLDLDKAWGPLQQVTARADDGPARPAHRMFEGAPSWGPRGGRPWVRTLVPDEVREIAADLVTMDEGEVATCLGEDPFVGRDLEEDIAYAAHYLLRARDFMTSLAADGRGAVYTIG